VSGPLSLFALVIDFLESESMSHKDAWLAWRGNTTHPRQYRKPTIVAFYDMAPIIVSPWPSSPDVARLVQDRLSRVQQQFPACSPNTLSDLRTVVNELSTISKTCDRVLNDIETREEETDVVTAFKEVENALDWAKCMFSCLKSIRRRVTKNSGSPPVCAQRTKWKRTRVSFPCTPQHDRPGWQL
jgi:hypothetical protein